MIYVLARLGSLVAVVVIGVMLFAYEVTGRYRWDPAAGGEQ